MNNGTPYKADRLQLQMEANVRDKRVETLKVGDF